MTIHGWEFAGVLAYGVVATVAWYSTHSAWNKDSKRAAKDYADWRAEFEKDLSAEIRAKEDLIRGLKEALAQRDDLDAKCRLHLATITDLEAQLGNVTRMYESARDGNNEYLACIVERNDKIFQLELSLQETEKLRSEKEALEKALSEEIRQKHQLARKKGRK